jgi:pyridoxal biosynthesis lyase PdxS
MLKGGVIMDVVTPEEARIAEEAGAVAVMALERVPADIRKEGGVARMSDPEVRDCCLVGVQRARGVGRRRRRHRSPLQRRPPPPRR